MIDHSTLVPDGSGRRRLRRWCASVLIAAVLPAPAVAAEEALTIVEGSIVYLEYRVELIDGTVVTSNLGKEPVVFEAGGDRILPALDRALRGRQAGEEGIVRLSAVEAFGEVDEELMVEVPLETLPEDARNVGTVVVAENPEGVKQRVEVREIREDTALLDYNHPLAGEEILYYVKILDVK